MRGVPRERTRTEITGLQGTIKNGQIVLDAPGALPEGTRVEVLPTHGAQYALGMREEDWPTTQDGIAALLARTTACR